jgi:hypothetical protein
MPTVLTATGFVDTDSRPSQIKDHICDTRESVCRPDDFPGRGDSNIVSRISVSIQAFK